MADVNKRKERTGNDRDQGGLKRSKGGSGGKWKTAHQITKTASRGGGKIEPGDVGIWVTCAKGQEGRATEELKIMFAECAERFYGILAEPEGGAKEDEDEDDDIEASIRKEMVALTERKKEPKMFSPVHINAPCVLFFKTRDPIDPADFVHRICKEVVTTPGVRRLKYVNRLTPMTLMGRATENGLDEVGKAVLGKCFQLSGVDASLAEETDQRTGFSYAIRPTIRTHKTLQRDAVIKQVAALVGASHSVNLTKPDKVILVEIYQTVCGMSVVGDDWETLKRYNLAELYGGYKQAIQARGGSLPKEPIPERASTDEAPRVS